MSVSLMTLTRRCMAEDSLLGTHSTQESINQSSCQGYFNRVNQTCCIQYHYTVQYCTHGHLLHTSNKDSRTLASYFEQRD